MIITYNVMMDPGTGDDFAYLSETEEKVSSVDDLIDRLQKFKEMHPNAKLDEEGVETCLKDQEGIVYFSMILRNEGRVWGS